MSTNDFADLLDERDHLIGLLGADARPVTDSGYNFVNRTGEIAYEVAGQRWNIILTRLDGRAEAAPWDGVLR